MRCGSEHSATVDGFMAWVYCPSTRVCQKIFAHRPPWKSWLVPDVVSLSWLFVWPTHFSDASATCGQKGNECWYCLLIPSVLHEQHFWKVGKSCVWISRKFLGGVGFCWPLCTFVNYIYLLTYRGWNLHGLCYICFNIHILLCLCHKSWNITQTLNRTQICNTSCVLRFTERSWGLGALEVLFVIRCSVEVIVLHCC